MLTLKKWCLKCHISINPKDPLSSPSQGASPCINSCKSLSLPEGREALPGSITCTGGGSKIHNTAMSSLTSHGYDIWKTLRLYLLQPGKEPLQQSHPIPTSHRGPELAPWFCSPTQYSTHGHTRASPTALWIRQKQLFSYFNYCGVGEL